MAISSSHFVCITRRGRWMRRTKWWKFVYWPKGRIQITKYSRISKLDICIGIGELDYSACWTSVGQQVCSLAPLVNVCNCSVESLTRVRCHCLPHIGGCGIFWITCKVLLSKESTKTCYKKTSSASTFFNPASRNLITFEICSKICIGDSS